MENAVEVPTGVFMDQFSELYSYNWVVHTHIFGKMHGILLYRTINHVVVCGVNVAVYLVFTHYHQFLVKYGTSSILDGIAIIAMKT